MNLNKSPTVSVIVPVYNVQNFLEECLNSVYLQTYRPIELIIVNDGSTDDSAKIFRKYSPEEELTLKIIEQDNQGLSVARNTGIEHASGDLIYFLDSDDWITSETFERCVSRLQEDKSDVVVFGAQAFGENLMNINDLNRYYSRDLPLSFYSSGFAFITESLLKGVYTVQACCYMYKFSAFSCHRFMPHTLHEDNFFSTLLFYNASGISVIKERFFQRRVRRNSITTSSKNFKYAEGFYRTVDKLLAELDTSALREPSINDYLKHLFFNAVVIEKALSESGLSARRNSELKRKYYEIISLRGVGYLCLNRFSSLFNRGESRIF